MIYKIHIFLLTCWYIICVSRFRSTNVNIRVKSATSTSKSCRIAPTPVTYCICKPSVLNIIIYAQMNLNTLASSFSSAPFLQYISHFSVSASMKVEIQWLDKADLRNDPNHPQICQLVVVSKNTRSNSSNHKNQQIDQRCQFCT